MAILTTGNTFADGDQVTSTKLNNIANAATFASGSVDDSTTQISSGAIIVKDLGISTGKLAASAVTTAKITDSNVTTAKIAAANITTSLIADSNVTKAKIENLANYKILGNVSGGAAAPAEVALLDEDNMSSNSATSLATQQSIKAYVDTQLTAEDLDFAGDSGTGSVDLDSQTFTIAGATGLDTAASGQTLTVSLDLNELATETSIAQDDFVAMVDNTDSGNGKITFSNLEDQVFGNVSGDILIAAGGAATIQANSVALGTDTTGNYVQSVTNGSYITGGDGGSESAALTLAVDATSANTASKVVARDSSGNFAAGTITAALTGNVTGNVTGNITGNVTGDLTGNSAGVHTGSVTGNVTGNLTGDVTGDVTGNLTGNVTSTGTSTFSTIDVNGGAIDGAIIGAASAAAITGTTITGTSLVGPLTGNVTGDLTGNVTASSVLASGVTATTQTSGDNSTKVATTAYVDAQVSADGGWILGGDSGSDDPIPPGQTVNFAGTTNEIETSVSNNTLTIGLPDDVTIAGNLTVNGTTTTVNTQTLSVEDPLIELANQNAANSVDVGLYGDYSLNSGVTTKYAGLFKDASDSDKFKLFKGLEVEPTTTVNTSGTGYTAADLVVGGLEASGDANFDSGTFFVDASANKVGIGTTSPTTPLHVQADGVAIKLDGSSSTTKSIFFRQTNSSNPAQVYADGSLRLFTEDSGTDIRFHVNSDGSSNEKMRINATGIGIGTAAPSTALDVAGSVKADGLTVEASISSTVSSATGTVARFINNASSSDAAIIDIVGGNTSVTSGEAISALYLSDANANGRGRVEYSHQNDSLALYSAAVPRLNIANNGDISFYEDTGSTAKLFWDASAESLGIGTSSPTVGKLQVNDGSGAIVAITRTSGATSGNLGVLRFGNTDVDSNLANISAIQDGSTTSSALTFETQSTGGATAERLRIDSSGQLILLGNGGSTTNSLDISYNGTSGEGKIQVDSGGGNTFLTLGTSDSGTVAERLRITSAGNVGIGTTGPQALLEVGDAASSSAVTDGNLIVKTTSTNDTAIVIQENSGSEQWGMGVNVDGDLAFTNSGNAASIVFDDSNNVGIGTTSPSYKLHLSEASTDFAALIANSTSSGNGLKIDAGDNSGDRILQLSDKDGNEKMRVGATGLVGIGTTSPSGELHVNNSSSASDVYISSGTTSDAIIALQTDTGGSAREARIGYDYSASLLKLVTGSGFSGSTSGINIDTSGNVGIKTASPSAALDVTGELELSSHATLGSNLYANRPSDAWTSSTTWINVSDYGALNSGGSFALTLNGNGYRSNDGDWTSHGNNSLNGATQIWQYPAGYITFNTNSSWATGSSTTVTERVRIDSDGNVGIGETSPDVLLHVGTGSIYQNKTGSGTFPGLSDTTSHGFMAESQGADGSTIHVSRTNSAAGNFSRQGTGDVVVFRNTSGSVTEAGSVEITGATSVAYRTSSDYRLKENVVDVSDGIDRVKQLNPVRFNFIGEDPVVDGFLAHEVQDVVPEAIGGEKDAMKDEEYEVSPAVYEDVVHPAVDAVYEDVVHPATYEEVVHPAVEATYDEDGNELTPAVEEYTEQVLLTEEYTEQVLVTEAVEEWTESVLVTEAVMDTRSVPDYQGIDQSKLVPLLTAALQEAVAKIEALEARVQTLEG